MQVPVRIGPDRRHLVDSRGHPWFYLADTAWQLFQSLDRDETRHYLKTRRDQGFNAIQAVAYPEFGGIDTPNRQGDTCMVNGDPARPNPQYFAHVEWVIAEANELGLQVLLLPTWGSHVTRAWATGPIAAFTPRSAAEYGNWIAERLGVHPGLIWCIGGDRAIPDFEARSIWDALAYGIRERDPGEHLMTWHPQGGSSSSHWVDDADWLDFRMVQSGHLRKASRNWAMIHADTQREPLRPVIDGEPCYENHPVYFEPDNGWFDEHDVRAAAWWAVLSGACGHSYGCHDVWMMADGARRPVASARGDWTDSLHLPGATQMRHVRALAESRLLPHHFADNSLVKCETQDTDHVAVARNGTLGQNDATSIVAYTPIRRPDFRIDTSCLGSPRLRWSWYDPRTGEYLPGGETENELELMPTFPTHDSDWVLVVDANEIEARR